MQTITDWTTFSEAHVRCNRRIAALNERYYLHHDASAVDGLRRWSEASRRLHRWARAYYTPAHLV